VTILAGVVPAHAVVGVDGTGALGDVKVPVHRVASVHQQESVVLAWLGDSLDVEVDDVGNGQASGSALGLEFHGHVANTPEISGQGPPALGWAAHLARKDLLHGLPLLRIGPLVNIEGRGPVSVPHGSRGVVCRKEVKSVQGGPV